MLSEYPSDTMTALTETVNSLVETTGTLRLNGNYPKPTPTETKVSPQPGPDYAYARLLPSFDHNYKLPPLEPFEHVDPGHAALTDAEPRTFLDGASVHHLTPKFGSEVYGIQLHKLDDRAKR